MKTLKLIATALLVLVITSSCDNSDDADILVVEGVENGEIVFDLQLEKHTFNTRLLALIEEEIALRSQLEQDPDNQDNQQQLEENLAEQEIVQARLNLVQSELVSFGIGPIPPPPPCADLPPADCPIGLEALQQLLISDVVENFSAQIIDIQTDAVLYQFQTSAQSDIREDLIALPLEIDLGQLPDRAIVQVQKQIGGEDRSYETLVSFR
ncbi:hypothetical protein [Aquimarina brevivitae]|uniref:Uncharacterized protein n=1 Tax=Aquimarina brevivitae TaxID=323412 RepID=A0A4Q7PEY9_9FLAO|nr:hypothetical protein [Aquimarina brevivitae]RZS99004.1 hypothetical protein EV197_0206 [Aquimarina brevivitae]